MSICFFFGPTIVLEPFLSNLVYICSETWVQVVLELKTISKNTLSVVRANFSPKSFITDVFPVPVGPHKMIGILFCMQKLIR